MVCVIGNCSVIVALNGRIPLATQFVHPFPQVEGSHARDAWTVRGLALVSSDGRIGKTSRRVNDAMQPRMSARRPLLLPVAGYDATFSPWPTSGAPRVSPILRRSCTGRRHNHPVFQTNMANE